LKELKGIWFIEFFWLRFTLSLSKGIKKPRFNLRGFCFLVYPEVVEGFSPLLCCLFKKQQGEGEEQQSMSRGKK
jgi:hypothetical protein